MALVLDKHNLRVVLRQMHMVEAALHKPIELHRLARRLKVGYERGVGYQLAPAQTQKTAEESVGG